MKIWRLGFFLIESEFQILVSFTQGSPRTAHSYMSSGGLLLHSRPPQSLAPARPQPSPAACTGHRGGRSSARRRGGGQGLECVLSSPRDVSVGKRTMSPRSTRVSPVKSAMSPLRWSTHIPSEVQQPCPKLSVTCPRPF